VRLALPHNGWKPRGYQRALWDFMEKGGRFAVANWHRRCLAEGTQVTLSNGKWKPIEELVPGDEILTWHEGEYVVDRVKDVWCAGIKSVVSVKASGFPEIICTEDHRFLRHDRNFGNAWREIGDFEVKGQNGSPDCVTILSGINTGIENAVDKAELFGYLITDGSVNDGQQPKFTNTERILCDRVAELAEMFGAVPKFREKGNGWDVGLSNGRAGGGEVVNPIKEMARHEGACAKRSERRAPGFLWESDNETLAAFFAAVVDGDGSLWLFEPKQAFNGKYVAAAAEVKIHAGESESLAWDYYWLLRKMGIAVSSVKLEKESCWTLRIWRRDAVFNLLEKTGHRIRHPRKSEKARIILDKINRIERLKYNDVWLAGISLEDAGIAVTWDIETENYHSFFANGYLVHNSGKDDVCLHHAAIKAHERVGNYWHMLPEYAQARKAIWDSVNPHTGRRRIDEAFPHELRKATREQEMMILFKNGSTWQVVGSDNYNGLMGTSPAGMTNSEYALGDPSAWAYFSPILMENNGWSLFISTPRGKNHFHAMAQSAKKDQDWFYQELTADDTSVFTKVQLESELRRLIDLHGAEYGRSLWLQEYFCSFEAAVVGSIWGDCVETMEREGRIAALNIEHEYPVHTAWDLGFTDDTAIFWFQTVFGELHVVDHYSASGKDIEHYASVLKARARERGFTYGTHWLPHDARPRTIAGGGKSIMQQLMEQNVGRCAIAPRLDKMEGIQAARATFKITHMDANRCEKAIENLRSYRRVWDDEKRIFSNQPLHDHTSHDADAFRYMSLVWKHPKNKDIVPSDHDRLLAGNVTGMTFGQIKKRHRDAKAANSQWKI